MLFKVTGSWKEPMPGWVDNLNGPTGMLAGAGKGVLRTLICHREKVADLIPVDIAINLMITVAWHLATTRSGHSQERWVEHTLITVLQTIITYFWRLYSSIKKDSVEIKIFNLDSRPTHFLWVQYFCTILNSCTELWSFDNNCIIILLTTPVLHLHW